MFVLALSEFLPIRSCEELQQISATQNYALFSDVDCSATPFVPIPEYYGNFYGQNKSITGLKILQPRKYGEHSFSTLFINATGASFSHLKIGMEIENCGDRCGFTSISAVTNYTVLELDVKVLRAVSHAVIGGLAV